MPKSGTFRSDLEKLKTQIAGGIIIGLVLLAYFFLSALVKLTWPACLLFAIAGVVRLVASGIAKRRDSKVAKAVAKVAFPYVCGFACVAVLQMVFNLGKSEADTVSGVEIWLIAQSGRIDNLAKIPWWQYVAILAVLGAAGVLAPRLRLLNRFVGVVGFVEAVSGVLATVTAFTFVSAAIAPGYVQASEVHFRARLADKERKDGKMMGDALANQAVAQSLERLPPASVKALAAILAQLHSAQASVAAADALLDRELEGQIQPDAKPPAPETRAAPAESTARGADLLRESAAEDKKAVGAQEADKASKEAVEAALDRAADNASDAVRKPVHDMLEHVLGDSLGPLLSSMADDFASEYMSLAREPLMKKANDYCDRLVERIASLRGPAAAAAAIKGLARSDALDEAFRIENNQPGNEEFERLAKGALGGETPVLGDRTAYLTRVIDIAVALTPGAKTVDWSGPPRLEGLPASAPPSGIEVLDKQAPASGPLRKLPARAGSADTELERAVEGVPQFRASETARIAVLKRLETERTESERLSELENEPAKVEPHGVP